MFPSRCLLLTLFLLVLAAGTTAQAQEVGHSCVAGDCSSGGGRSSWEPTAAELAADARERRNERERDRYNKYRSIAEDAVEKARKLRKRGDFAAAVKVVQDALQNTGGYDKLRTRLEHQLAWEFSNWGISKAEAGDYIAAINLFAGGLKIWDEKDLRENLAVAQNNYAMALLRQGELEGALELIRQASLTQPNTPLFQNNERMIKDRIADEQNRAEAQRQKQVNDAHDKQTVQSAIGRAASEAAAPVPAQPGLAFQGAGGTSSALQQAENARAYGERARGIPDLSGAKGDSNQQFDSAVPPGSAPPSKLKLNPRASQLYRECQEMRGKLDKEHQELSDKLDGLRKQRPPDSQPTVEEANIKAKLLKNEEQGHIVERQLIDITLPFDEDDAPAPGTRTRPPQSPAHPEQKSKAK